MRLVVDVAFEVVVGSWHRLDRAHHKVPSQDDQVVVRSNARYINESQPPCVCVCVPIFRGRVVNARCAYRRAPKVGIG